MNKRNATNLLLVLLLSLSILAGCSSSKDVLYQKQPGYENVKAGKFDNGKMWTFDFPQ